MALMPITLINSWTKLFSSNQTTASFVSILPTTTAPSTSTAGVFVLSTSSGGINTPGRLQFFFFGAGANNTTGKFRLYAWDTVTVSGSTTLYVPICLWEVTATLSSTLVGVALASLVATDLIADGVALTAATAVSNEDFWVTAPANDAGIATVTCLDRGYTTFQVTTDLNSSSTNLNCCYKVCR